MKSAHMAICTVFSESKQDKDRTLAVCHTLWLLMTALGLEEHFNGRSVTVRMQH